MSTLYIDSSVLVSIALNSEKRREEAMKHIHQHRDIAVSEIAIVECQSGISRCISDHPSHLIEAEQKLNQIIARMTIIQIDSILLGHARSLVKSYSNTLGLRTLDSIHIATANIIRQRLSSNLTYITSDIKQHEVFTAEGHIGHLIQ